MAVPFDFLGRFLACLLLGSLMNPYDFYPALAQ